MNVLKDLEPFNIDLLIVDDQFVKDNLLKPITSLSIIDKSSHQFDANGLFSNDIFGTVGSAERVSTLAYIPLNIEIIHPELFRNIIMLKKLYKDIFASKEYAVIKDGDLVKSNIIEGQTGYKFMIDSLSKLKLKDNGSNQRSFIIRLLDKYKDVMVKTSNILVLPAGLRDYEVDKNGKPSEHEVNSLYRKILNVSNLINKDLVRNDIQSLDKIRFNIQSAVHDLYMFYLDFLGGSKRGFLTGKFVRRNTFNTTRNVLSSTVVKIETLNDPNNISGDDTIKGLFQTCVDLMPILAHQLYTGIVGHQIPNDGSAPARLINTKTLKTEDVELSVNELKTWNSLEGISKLVSKFKQEEIRHKEVKIAGHYLAMIYKGTDNTFKVIYNMDEVPPNIDKSLITPITMAELLYLSIYKIVRKYPMLLARYPITREGSNYPSNTYMLTTLPSEARTELNDMWDKTDIVAPRFPIKGKRFMNAMSPHHTHLANLGADFDGDQGSSQSLYTEESIDEINSFLNSKEAYISPAGQILYSASTDIAEYCLGSLIRGI